MMQSEFLNRTHVWLTDTEWLTMTNEYNASDKSKDAFCKAWMKDNLEGVTYRIMREVYNLREKVESDKKEVARVLVAKDKANKTIVDAKDKEIARLKAVIEDYERKFSSIAHICNNL